MATPNIQMGSWRTRVLNPNGKPYSDSVRIRFYEVGTTDDKSVYYDQDSLVPYGAIVELDGQGYSPVEGIWLGVGAYTADVQILISTDSLGTETWNTLYSVPRINGKTSTDSTDGSALLSFDNISGLVNFEPDGSNAIALGYYASGDLGGGVFKWDAVSTATVDGGSVFKPASYATVDPGRWIRVFDGIPSIRDWGASETLEDNYNQIINAINYVTDSTQRENIQLVLPTGEFTYTGTTLTFSTYCIVEDGAYFESGDLITWFNGCDIRSMHTLSDNPAFVNVDRIKPEWYGAVGDGVINDSEAIAAAYSQVDIRDGIVYFTQNYVVRGATFNSTANETACLFSPTANFTCTEDQATFSLGKIYAEEGASGFLDGDMENMLFRDNYRSSYFNTVYSTVLEDKLSTQIFIWDTDHEFTVDFTSVGPTYKFENGATWTINSGVTVYVAEQYFDITNFDSIDSVCRIGGKITLSNHTRYTTSLRNDLTFQSEITFDRMSFIVATDAITLHFGYKTIFDQCDILESGTKTLLIEGAADGLDIIRTNVELETAIYCENARIEYGNLTTLSLVGGTGATLTGMAVRHNRVSGYITLISAATDTVVTNLYIEDNTFLNELASVRILSSGDFLNEASSHDFTIQNNTAPTAAEQTYIPMTDGYYFWRSNESVSYVDPAVTVFDSNAYIVDDNKYNGYTIFSRQVFSFHGTSDLTDFDKLEMTDARSSEFNVTTGEIDEQYKLTIMLKPTTIGDALTNGALPMNRLPTILSGQTGTITVNWDDGIVHFSTHNRGFKNTGLTPFLP